MSQTIVERLREGLASFPLTERRVAHRLLADDPIAGLQSASDLARTTGVSSPTVLRLVARLGFAAYPEFQRRLREELAAQLSSPLAKESTDSDPNGRNGHFIDRFATAVTENLRETFANLSHAEVELMMAMLSDRKLRIHLVGGRFTDALACYLSVQMRILRPGVHHLQHREANWHDQLLDIGRRDVMLVFDIRRYQPSLFKLAEAAGKRGATILLITDQWLSPIAKLARHVLPARVTVPSIWDSNAALLAISEVLLAGITQRDRDFSRARIRDLERLREG